MQTPETFHWCHQEWVGGEEWLSAAGNKPEGNAGGRSALEGRENENRPNVLNTDASAKNTISICRFFFFTCQKQTRIHQEEWWFLLANRVVIHHEEFLMPKLWLVRKPPHACTHALCMCAVYWKVPIGCNSYVLHVMKENSARLCFNGAHIILQPAGCGPDMS